MVHGASLAAVAVVLYALRFGSVWFVTDTASREFDPHAFGLLGDWFLWLALALPLLALLGWALWRRRPWRGLFVPASAPSWTALSLLVLLLLGAPTPGQYWALALLPAAESWPVLAAALAWFGLVAVLRARAVAAPGATGSPARSPSAAA